MAAICGPRFGGCSGPTIPLAASRRTAHTHARTHTRTHAHAHAHTRDTTHAHTAATHAHTRANKHQWPPLLLKIESPLMWNMSTVGPVAGPIQLITAADVARNIACAIQARQVNAPRRRELEEDDAVARTRVWQHLVFKAAVEAHKAALCVAVDNAILPVHTQLAAAVVAERRRHLIRSIFVIAVACTCVGARLGRAAGHDIVEALACDRRALAKFLELHRRPRKGSMVATALMPPPQLAMALVTG